ncbi:MAG: hypothetical protein HEQ13_27765 [Dolichospermum sp. DEX189]|uniref:Uncharacterized protein n=2 Tax=Cyanophyceae TaxID=3028117 RepID=A0ABR8BVE9_APHFL|nr:hypothetical protein [Aphanizomenon flos-aquae FACHB-1040]MBO1072902.1 hypothetical protein [Dolichospermum sp. DEX189]
MGTLSRRGVGFLLIARTPMNNMIVHYQGFQIEIYENHPTWIEQRYASEVSLSSHPDFYIFDGNACTPDFDSCLIQSLRNCDDLVRDYGANVIFEPTLVLNPPGWNDPDNF